jgi:anaerobic magnesium-protoporphyrin IX monomethyl ester cyclase
MTPSLQDSRFNILLIQPPIRDFYLTAKRTIPYGLASIAAGLIEAGFSVQILDALATPKSRVVDLPPEMSYLRPFYGRPDQSPFALFHHFKHFGYSFDTIGQRVKKAQPFLVGISSLFSAYTNEAVQTAQIVKVYHPNCKIVVGGHHATAMPARVMESSAVDFVLRGEGEVSMARFAKALRNGTGYDEIPGLVYRKPDGSLHVGETVSVRNPDDLPLPATQLIDQRYYRRNKTAGAVVVASRGCPLKCTYCSMGASSPLSYRQRSVASVIREIEIAVNQYHVGFIDFEDENLSLDRNWFLKLLDEIAPRFAGKQPELRAMNGLLPSALDEQVIAAMQAAGFRTLNLSLGTTAAAQLKRFQRPDVRRAFERALDLALTYDLQAVGYIIVGAPFQKAADSLKDLLYLAERRVLVGTSVFYPSPGSKDYMLCASLGLLPQNFSCMRSSALPLSHITTRKESVTLLRLSRIINFMKSLIDSGLPLPRPAQATSAITTSIDRREVGRQLLQFFLYDGIIRGVNPDGEVFEHEIDLELCKKFLAGIKSIRIRGCEI